MCVVTTSTASFADQDLADLPSILADDLATQLLMSAERTISKAVDADQVSDIFWDDLEGVVRVPSGAGLQ